MSEKFWCSRKEALARFAVYIEYQAELKTAKLPLKLEILEYDVSTKFSGEEIVSKDTHQQAFFRGKMRALGRHNRFEGLLYLMTRVKDPHKVPYWCKLEESPWQVAAKSENPGFLELVERSVCVKSSLRPGSNPWIGIKDIVDFTFLKMAAPILFTIIAEDYLK